MKLNHHLFMIAFRQLANRKRQTLLSLLGISVGVMVLIAAVSLMDGLLQSFIQKIVQTGPHVIVSGERVRPIVPEQLVHSTNGTQVVFVKNVNRQGQRVIKNYPQVESLIASDPLVQLVSPSVSMDVIGTFGAISQPVRLFGMIPSREDRIEQFSTNMVSGSFGRLARTPDGIMLGSTVANDFNVRVGDRMQIVGQSGAIYSVQVVGIFTTGISSVDGNCYVNMRLGQAIGGFPADEVSNLFVRVNDLPKDGVVAKTIEAETNYTAITWEQQSASVVALFKMISGIVYFLVFFVIMVAGFGVANVLITNVLEKARDIAVLKSLGFKKSEITWIYLIQGLIVALVGSAIGCLAGFLLVEIMSSIPMGSSSSGSIVTSSHLMIGSNPMYYVMASVFAVTVSLVAAVGPSRKAAKVSPVEILRGER